MRRIRSLLVIAGIAVSAGCYQAVINTGRQPNGQTIERKWAHSFLGGLVPPSVTETAAACPGGVARVETQHSFLNMVANFITLGIYSPMEITVQCAGGDVPEAAERVDAARTDADAAVTEAVLRSRESGAPVWVLLQ